MLHIVLTKAEYRHFNVLESNLQVHDTGSSLLDTVTLSELGSSSSPPHKGSDDISAEAIGMMVVLLFIMTLVSESFMIILGLVIA